MWAFGVTGCDAPDLMVAVARAAPIALSCGGGPVAISNLVLALGYEQKVADVPGLFDEVALAAARRVADLDPRDAGEFFTRVMENGRITAQ